MISKKKILSEYKKTLEDRDREDRELFGWKGGQTVSYRESLDLDAFLENKEE